MEGKARYVLVIPDAFEPVLKRLKKRQDLEKKFSAHVKKILREPMLGKPLRNVLKNYRRIHIESYVLIYEIQGQEVRLIDFDRHDNIYKKYR